MVSPKLPPPIGQAKFLNTMENPFLKFFVVIYPSTPKKNLDSKYGHSHLNLLLESISDGSNFFWERFIITFFFFKNIFLIAF